MTPSKKDQIRALLKSIETGDPEPIAVVDEARYIQHNPQTQEGSEGLVALFRRLSKTSPRVNIVRAFEDGDFVFAHTEYDFASRKIGFEIFRFDGSRAVEHWDNIQERLGPNPFGHSMVDGPTEATDLDLTEVNRALVLDFVETVLIDGQINRLTDFMTDDSFTDHNPRQGDGAALLRSALQAEHDGGRRLDYHRIHRVLAEGNFVLCVSEGRNAGRPSAFYDLFRLANGKLVEHWDTTEKIAPVNEWKNDNGKF
ncbi:MAG: nuclear transport factor 2 family protein [Sneathiella sp.]|uniref:nuclear transport factor 2 family protein n=1 Tax=Sneathiella sp. TaxID=1964365 RepID=UPI0030013D5A